MGNEIFGKGGGGAKEPLGGGFPFFARLSRFSLPGVGGRGLESGPDNPPSIASEPCPIPEVEALLLETALVVRRGGAGVRFAGSTAGESNA